MLSATLLHYYFYQPPCYQRAFIRVYDRTLVWWSLVLISFHFLSFWKKLLLLDSGIPHTSGFLPHMYISSQWLPIVLNIDLNSYLVFMARSLAIQICQASHYSKVSDLQPHIFAFRQLNYAPYLRDFLRAVQFFPLEFFPLLH